MNSNTYIFRLIKLIFLNRQLWKNSDPNKENSPWYTTISLFFYIAKVEDELPMNTFGDLHFSAHEYMHYVSLIYDI